MVDVGTSEISKGITRRRFCTLAAGFLGLALVGCEEAKSTTESAASSPRVITAAASTPTVGVTSAELIRLSRIQTLADAGLAMRSAADVKMLTETKPGIDLTYSNNATIDKIRKIQDPTERVLAAIGYLDVQHAGRYNDGSYVCNVYALDLLRLLLDNNVIGSRYNKANGKPMALGPKDLNWSSNTEVKRIDQQYPFLHSNNLDWWLKTYGVQFGWQQVLTKEQLQKLGSGNIQLGVTKEELIRNKQIEIGHAFVLANDGSSYILSQATDNIRAKAIPYSESNLKSDPAGQYNFWTHPLVPPSAR